MCSCECFCETESVWGLAEWETSILFGHTAESHSPYSPTLTFWNGLPVCDCFFYHATQASLPSRSFFLHHFAISQGALGSPGSLISLLINICYSSPAFFPIRREHNTINIFSTFKTHHKGPFISGRWKKKTNGEGDRGKNTAGAMLLCIHIRGKYGDVHNWNTSTNVYVRVKMQNVKVFHKIIWLVRGFHLRVRVVKGFIG